MNVPEHLWRFPTRAAIDALATRFGLRNEPDMQDWEWEVADPNRIEEFLRAYESGELTEGERFVLMETIIQSFDESEHPLTGNPLWERILTRIEENITVHIHTVWYWACLGEKLEDSWRVAPSMRKILKRHRHRFEKKR